MKVKRLTALLITTIAGSFFLYADEVTDTINEALSAYEKGDTVQATEDLNYALELIRQQKGNRLKSFLPEPLSGWKAGEVETESMGAAMMGGGMMLHRNYHKDNAEIAIEIVTDSPLIQSMSMMFSNPMFAAGKLKRIHKQKAIIEYNANQHAGKLSMMVDNRILITIKGRNVSENDLIAYAKAIDIEGMKKL
jgi:hypothetical protein